MCESKRAMKCCSSLWYAVFVFFRLVLRITSKMHLCETCTTKAYKCSHTAMAFFFLCFYSHLLEFTLGFIAFDVVIVVVVVIIVTVCCLCVLVKLKSNGIISLVWILMRFTVVWDAFYIMKTFRHFRCRRNWNRRYYSGSWPEMPYPLLQKLSRMHCNYSNVFSFLKLAKMKPQFPLKWIDTHCIEYYTR